MKIKYRFMVLAPDGWLQPLKSWGITDPGSIDSEDIEHYLQEFPTHLSYTVIPVYQL